MRTMIAGLVILMTLLGCATGGTVAPDAEAERPGASVAEPATVPDPATDAPAPADGSRAASALSAARDAAAEVATEDEGRFIARYVETMTYLVFHTEGAVEAAARAIDAGRAEGEFLLRGAVNQAVGFLVERGRLVVDSNQVARLSEDRRLVYEEQTGREESVLQWVARRLNADVYVELDARLSSRTSGSGHYASADVTMNMYETSTGQILGTVNRRSEESYSRNGIAEAAANALQATVYQAMPLVVDMAERQMSRALERGIRYEVTLQNPPDARALSRFRGLLEEEARSVATVTRSPEEVLLEVFFVGSADDLADLVFAVCDRAAGFEDVNMVMSRGNALTFDVGW